MKRLPSLSPEAYRRITLIALIALGAIVVTGGAVRLTGSGLGCPQWPNCDTAHLAPHGDTSYHTWVEFVNRVFTSAVSIAVVLAVLGSLIRVPRRRDLTWLSAGLVAGVAGQIVLGGLTVIYGLSPPWVMAHFLVSMVLIADGVVLHVRAGWADNRPVRPVVSRALLRVGWVLLAAAAAVLVTGTVVTGAGPHGGDENVSRLDVSVSTVAKVHGGAENLFLVAVLVTLWMMHRERVPASVRKAGYALLVVLVAQAIVGYTQYFTGVPVVLVGIHLAGAVLVWASTLWLVMSLRAPVPD